MSRLVASLGEWRLGGAEWVERVRESVHLWNAVPISLAAVTLAAGGFWVGSMVGGDGGGAGSALTRTVRVKGEVITIGGVRYVSTPARVVRIRGRDVHLAARTVPLSGSTTHLPGQTILVSTTVNGTSVATVVQTVTVPPVTVTAPASTVTGPTTTVSNTVTVPVFSTVTITIP